jgi:Zn-dependent protease with chaperone function
VLALAIALGLVGLIAFVAEWMAERTRYAVFPTGIVLLIGLGGLIATFAVCAGVYQSLRPRARWEPALVLDMSAEHHLQRLVESICTELGCRRPTAVLMSAEPSFSVQQGKVRTLDGIVRGRVLTLGCPLISCLTVSEFKAILYHEFAHFTGRDTLYSAFVLPVYVGIQATLARMDAVILRGRDDKSETATYMSLPMLLPYWVLSLYIRRFHRLNASLGRLRETRADIIAALHAGSDMFASALKKIVRIGGLFSRSFRSDIVEGLSRGRAYVNYYESFRRSAESAGDALDAIERAALADAGGYDMFHPPLRERLQWLSGRRESSRDSHSARSLFSQVARQEERLTHECTRLLAHVMGVVRPADTPSPERRQDPRSTALHRAASEGDAQTVAELLAQGVNPDSQDEDGWTPLHWAASEDYAEVAQILIDAGADASAVDDEGWTPLHWAAAEGYADIARLLLDAGADTTVEDNAGQTPLQRASAQEHTEVIDLLR